MNVIKGVERAPKRPTVQTSLITSIILGEDVLKVLGPESSFVIICHAVAAMLILVKTVNPDAEEWIWKPAMDGGIRQSQVNNQRR